MASTPSIFQKTMDTILQGMNGVICYLDDILISGKTEEEHLDNLRRVLLKLKEHGIRAKKAKCTFLKTSVRYLGHVIDTDGLHATDDKIKAIVNTPHPRSVAELRSFLGLLNYYGRFIPNLSSLNYPLNNLLWQKTTWRWMKACSDAFTAVKEQIVLSNILTHYDTTLPVRLAADTSAYSTRAVISHVMEDGLERPIAVASRTLSPVNATMHKLRRRLCLWCLEYASSTPTSMVASLHLSRTASLSRPYWDRKMEFHL